MTDKPEVHIEIFSDVICPWCFIGKRHLEAAARTHDGVRLKPHWRAFLLNPRMPPGGMARDDYLTAKFGNAGRGFYERIARVGAEAGIAFNFDAIRRTPDSRPAHALIRAARATEGADSDGVVEDLFITYFINGMNIEDKALLEDIATRHGVPYPIPEAAAALVEEDLRDAARLRISGVPFFILAGDMAVSGAQPPAVFAPLFDTAATRKN